MGTIIKHRLAISSRISKPSFHSQRFDTLQRTAISSTRVHYRQLSFFQFFTQSNPLNNLNSITSSIPPILQRQNSAPTVPQNHQPSNQLNGDFYKPNNIQKTVAQSAPSAHQPTPSTAGEIHRKYSLPMNTMPSQPMVPSSYTQRKQSAPIIHPIAQSSQPPLFQPQQQLQHQLQPPHGSPSRARDRNQFDKVPTSQDVQQLPFLKGGTNDAHRTSCSSFYVPIVLCLL